MRLIMMVSRDGYVARAKDDDMSWTGKTDKQVFRLLTCVGGTLACGSKTWEMMPKRLAGRHMIRLSTKPNKMHGPGFVQDLKWYSQAQPDGWLIGGKTIAVEALKADLVDQMFVCKSDRYAFPPDGGIAELKSDWRSLVGTWEHSLTVDVVDVKVEVWNRRR